MKSTTGRVFGIVALWVALAACLCVAACGGLYALAAYMLSDL